MKKEFFKFIINNNMCQIICNKDNQIAMDFLDNHITGYEEEKEINGGYTKKIKVPVALYLEEKLKKGLLQYTFPRGLYDILPDNVKNNIPNVINNSTNNIIIDVDIKKDKNKLASVLQPESGFNLRDDQVMCLYKSLRLKRGLNQYPTGCLIGSTKIMIDEDESLSIEELIKKGYKDKKVISIDKRGNVKSGTIKNVFETKKVTQLYKITISDKQPIYCTDNHPFMLYNHRYVSADKLIIGDTIMDIKPEYSDYHKKYTVNTKTYSISNIEIVQYDTSIPVYDLEIESYHNFTIDIGNSIGIVVHNSGKTEMMSGIIRTLVNNYPDIKILVIEPTDILVQNTAKRFQKYKIDAIPYKTNRESIENNVIVSHPMALLNDLQKNPKLLENINGVFWDECFEESTLVKISEDRELTIKEIYDSKDIDKVLSYNTKTNTVESKRILRKIKTEHNKSFWILRYINPTTGKLEKLLVTPNHKFYIETVISERKYIPLNELQIEDRLLFIYKNNVQQAKIFSIEKDNAEIKEYRYNLEIEDNHNYFAGGILVSNCHHVSCSTWSLLNVSVPNAEYTLGFSALAILKEHINTINLKELDIDETLCLGAVGRVINNVGYSYYFKNNILTTPKVIQLLINTRTVAPTENNWQKLMKSVIENNERLKVGCRAINIMTKYKRRSMILVATKVQAFKVAKILADEFNLESEIGIAFGSGEGYLINLDKYREYKAVPIETETKLNTKNKVLSKATIKKKESELQKKELERFKKCLEPVKNITDKFDNKEFKILIGTSFADEGLDISHLDGIFLACSGVAMRRKLQQCGRALRKSKTGKYSWIIDIYDYPSKVLEYHSNTRMKIFREIIEIPNDCIYPKFDINDFERLFVEQEEIDTNKD